MILNQLPSQPHILFLDLETWHAPHKMSDPFFDGIALATVSDGRETYVLTEGFERLQPFVDDPKLPKVCHNANFDFQFLKQLGLHPVGAWDTLLTERVLTAGTELGCGLEEVARRRFDIALDKSVREEFAERGLNQHKLDYAAKDVEVLVPLWEAQQAEVSAGHLRRVVDLENNLVPVVVDMELRGIRLDAAAWNEIKTREERLRDEVYRDSLRFFPKMDYQTGFFGDIQGGVNFNSPLVLRGQLAKIGIDVENTREETLRAALAKDGSLDVLRAILDYRGHERAAGWDYPQYVNRKTGRIHPDWNQMGADTARFSCSDPNIQQVPRAVEFRKMFVAAVGYYLIAVDFNQLQMRLMAEVSRCSNMLRGFREKRDLHSEIASKAYGEHVGKGDPRRQLGKNTNFAKIFGAGPNTLANTLQIDFQLARKLSRAFDHEFPEVREWCDKSWRFLMEHGHVADPLGRKRWFPEVAARVEHPGDYQELENPHKYRTVAANTPIQSYEADVVKLCLIELHRCGYHPVLMAHDEIVLEEQDPTCVDDVCRIMRETAADVVYRVPLEVEGCALPYWGKA